MKKIPIHIFLASIFLSACTTTEQEGVRGIEGSHEVATENENSATNEANAELDREMIETVDLATGEKKKVKASEIFRIVDPDTPPKLLRLEELDLPDGFTGTIEAVVSLEITSKAEVRNVTVDEINRSEYSEAIKRMIERSQFSSATLNGEPVAVRIRVPVKHKS